MRIRTILSACMAIVLPMTMMAQDDKAQDGSDFGVWMSVEGVKKVDKKFSVGMEAELRTRDDCGELDRWSVGASVNYKFFRWLKASAGYVLIDSHTDDKYTYHTNGNLNKWTPDFWSLRHRFFVSLTGSVGMGRLGLSLRERWQYTYRPEKEVQRWDDDDEEWTPRLVASKAKNVLRSRIQLTYDIQHSAWEPYASVEFYNAWNLQKIRYTVGTEYKLSKQHAFSAFYRYQHNHDYDDSDADKHILGLGYTYKF